MIAVGFKGIKKYKQDLIQENIKEHLVDKKDIENENDSEGKN